MRRAPALAYRALVCLLVGVPLVIALVGPWVASPRGRREMAFMPTPGVLGTDFAGRDVLGELLRGGQPIVATALAATALTYLVAVPLALLVASSRRRGVDEIVMRPLDIVLAVPSLLLLILLAGIGHRGPALLVAVVVVVLTPDAVRVLRAAALGPASSTAYEALLLQGESFDRRVLGHVGRAVPPTVLADAGVRFVGALYLVATASFLGVGVDPDAANWGVMVSSNRSGMLIHPAPTLAPALLMVSLAVGLNLLVDLVVGARRSR